MKVKQALLACISIAFICIISSCSKPAVTRHYVLVSPADNSLHLQPGQVFTCSDPGDVATYKFYFNDNTAGTAGYTTVATNSATATNLTSYGAPLYLVSGHSYTWYVIFQLTDGSDVSSPTWSFSIQ